MCEIKCWTIRDVKQATSANDSNQIKELIENNGIKPFFGCFYSSGFQRCLQQHFFYIVFFYLLYFEEQTFSAMKDNDFNQALKCHSLGMWLLNASEEEQHHPHKPAGQPRREETSVCGALIQHPDTEILQLPSQRSSPTRPCFHSLYI